MKNLKKQIIHTDDRNRRMIQMADWREIINEALADESGDPIALFRKYEQAADAAIEEAQSCLNDVF